MIIFGTDRNFYAVFTSWKGIHLRVYRVSHITILYPGSFHIHGKTLPGEYYIAFQISVIQYFNTESTDATTRMQPNGIQNSIAATPATSESGYEWPTYWKSVRSLFIISRRL